MSALTDSDAAAFATTAPVSPRLTVILSGIVTVTLPLDAVTVEAFSYGRFDGGRGSRGRLSGFRLWIGGGRLAGK